MMDRRKAAQYFIVAWVKDWSLLTYLQVLAEDGPRIEFADAHSLYPWLGQWAFKGRRRTVRTYLAESNRPLSDALWDAADDRARLALAPQVEAFVFNGQSRGYINEARKSFYRTDAERTKRSQLEQASIEDRHRRRGYHWQVCK
jgi:hypothetical protein